MSLTTEQFEELCSTYALGALSPDDESMLFEILEENNTEFENIFSETVGVSFLLNQSVISSTPSAAAKRELIKKINAQNTLTTFSSFTRIEKISMALGFGNPRFALLFSLFLLIIIAEISAYTFVMYRDGLERENQLQELETKVKILQQQIGEQKPESNRNDEILNILQLPGTEGFVLSGSEINPQGSAKIFINRAHNIAILQFTNLPFQSDDKEYHLWVSEKENTWILAGTFTLTSDNDGVVKIHGGNISSETSMTGVSITLEQKGNNTQPDGPVYLSGTQKILQTN